MSSRTASQSIKTSPNTDFFCGQALSASFRSIIHTEYMLQNQPEYVKKSFMGKSDQFATCKLDLMILMGPFQPDILYGRHFAHVLLCPQSKFHCCAFFKPTAPALYDATIHIPEDGFPHRTAGTIKTDSGRKGSM